MEHTIFYCIKFDRQRTAIESVLGRRPILEDTQKILCGDGDLSQIHDEALRSNVRTDWEDKRRSWTKMVEAILAEKEEDKRRRQAEVRAVATVRGRRRRWRAAAAIRQ